MLVFLNVHWNNFYYSRIDTTTEYNKNDDNQVGLSKRNN